MNEKLQPRPARDRRNLWVCLALLVGTIALYWPVLAYDYVNYDDPREIIHNPHINTGLHWGQIGWLFQIGFASNWFPLTWFSHALDFQIYGSWAGGHHLTNVLLHATSAIMLFFLLRRVTKSCWSSALVAALFAWHPLRVESVAWVSERKDCLSCLFYIAAIIAYARYTELLGGASKPDDRFLQRGRLATITACGAGAEAFRWFWLSMTLFAFGWMAKPMVVTLPFALLLLDFWPLNRIGSGGGFPRALPALLLEKIPFILLSIAGSMVTLIAQHRGGAVQTLQLYPLSFRLGNAAHSYLWYVEKTFWPTGLMVIYPTAVLPNCLVATAIMFLLVASFLAWRWKQTRPYLLLGWCWYLGTLAPVTGIVQAGVQARADRFSYLPSIGLLVALVWGLNDLTRNWPWRRGMLGIMAGCAIVACAITTRVQLAFWRNGETLFTRAVTVMPGNYVAWDFLGMYHLDLGLWDKTCHECQNSLTYFPENGYAHYNLGMALWNQKKNDQAEHEFRLAMQYIPDQLAPFVKFGRLMMSENRPSEAAAAFRKALSLEPETEGLHFSLAKALASSGDVNGAADELRECLRLAPEDIEADLYLAPLLEQQGKKAEAVTEYQKVLRKQPDAIPALNNLAWIRATDQKQEIRDGQQAVELALRACKLTKDQAPMMIGTLAAAYAEAGRFDDAVAAAQKALDLAASRGNKSLAARNHELLELYKSHRPCRE